MAATRDEADNAAERAFVLQLGRGLHSYGYPAHQLEDALAEVSARLGLQGQFFSTPTALFASFGDDRDQHTFQIRIPPGEVNLAKLTLLEALIRRVIAGLPPAEASAEITRIVQTPPPYGRALTTVAFALASGAASRFFGGGLREMAAATLIGLVLGLLALLAGRVPNLGRVFEPVAAAVAAFMATVVALHVAGTSVYVATVSGLIVLIPGFSLTIAMTELATRNLASGTARLAGASVTFLSIGFGVALGRTVAARLFGEPAVVTPLAAPGWTEWVALLLAPLCFVVLLRAQPRDAPWIVASGVLAYLGARTGAALLGPELGVFVGATVVAVASNGYARALGRPSSVPLVPGILLLVPGSLGFQSMASLLERETVPGVESAFRMTLVAVALATGLLFANAVFPGDRVR